MTEKGSYSPFSVFRSPPRLVFKDHIQYCIKKKEIQKFDKNPYLVKKIKTCRVVIEKNQLQVGVYQNRQSWLICYGTGNIIHLKLTWMYLPSFHAGHVIFMFNAGRLNGHVHGSYSYISYPNLNSTLPSLWP